MDLSEPRVMGIINVTPDSFFAWSRVQTEQELTERANQMAAEGAAILDVGACSTRPGSTPVSEQEETERLRRALDVVRRTLPYTPLSVDTFRPQVARMAVEEFGADIVNDVGDPSDTTGGEAMMRTVSRLGVPYVLTAAKATMRETLLFFAEKVNRLRDMGQKDIILDPGFGFGKTVEQNYELMSQLEQLQVMELPVLAGVSRKSMVYKRLGVSADESLNGTTALNTIALMKGASLLRVHDVREAVECIRIVAATMSQHR